jgi:hypothetical protein
MLPYSGLIPSVLDWKTWISVQIERQYYDTTRFLEVKRHIMMLDVPDPNTGYAENLWRRLIDGHYRCKFPL